VPLALPQEVFLLAEYFGAGASGGVPSGWSLLQGTQPQTEVVQESRGPEEGPPGRALRVTPKKGPAVLRHVPAQLPAVVIRLHLRARFYDEGAAGATHWLGLGSRLGAGAVGLAPGVEGYYATSRDFRGDRPEDATWRRSAVPRSVGWHLFELVLQEETFSASVDGEPVGSAPAQGASAAEELLLGTAASARGAWAALELLHTPLGYGTWELGIQEIRPGNRRPWRIRVHKEGRWRVSGTGAVEELPEASVEEEPVPAPVPAAPPPPEPPAAEEEPPPTPAPPEESEQEDTAEEASEPEELPEQAPEPAPEAEAPPARRRASPKRRPQRKRNLPAPAPPDGSLTIDCWDVAGESDVQRMDRVVGLFLQKLQEANVVLPENFARLGQCEEPQHPGCFVYAFGTRRLHISLREGEGGRLTLVVRCGGGFLDFVGFVRRHGGLEQLKLTRRPDSRGGQHIQLVSVLTRGTLTVRERPGTRGSD